MLYLNAVRLSQNLKIVQFTYAKDTILTRTTTGTSTVKLGTTIGNIGLEGITYDPQTNGYVIVKELGPEGIFQTTIDFAQGTASNGSATTVNSINLFDPGKLSLADLADVYALSNVTALNGKDDSGHLLVLSQESGRILNVDRSGKVYSALDIKSTPGDKLSVPNQSHEGIAVDKNGILYVVSENGGGDIDHPQLWVYAPTQPSTPLVNQAPTAVLLNNSINTIADKTSIATRFKVGDIGITDDGLGTNNLTLTGADASSFEIFESGLYVKAGTTIDFSTKASYNVSVNVDDPDVGTNPDAFKAFTLSIADPNPVTNAGGLFITEVAPWSSGNWPIAADWFELTNTSKSAINITGWKFDDNSNSFSSALNLDGITSIGVGESVVFVETSTVPDAVARFKSNWFGTNVPATFKIGSYSGTGAGLSTNGDAVNIYNATGDLQANVVFGGSTLASPYATFDNAALANNATISTLSEVDKNGGFSIFSSLKFTEIGSPGSIPINGSTTAADTLNGTAGNDTLFGLAGNDTINGGAGNDTIYGGAGVDLLFGGAGADVFGFNNPNEGIDKINDFVVGEDRIAISRDGFGGDGVFGTTSPIGGALAPSRFTLGSSARLNDDRFIYNPNSGALFFDADGAGGNAQVRIAQLVGNPALTSASFVMV